jgi:hypothetical protein
MSNISKPPEICLCVSLFNEEAVIPRFLENFLPIADHLVAVFATGAAPRDKTEEIVTEMCKKSGVTLTKLDYKNSEPDWKHTDSFAKARQMGWDFGRLTGAKYLIWADADDVLTEGSAAIIRKAAAEAEKDLYIIPYHVRGTHQITHRERMVVNDGSSYWRYGCHEQLAFRRKLTFRLLKDAAFDHQPLPGKAFDPTRNRSILLKAVEDAPRDLYYLHSDAFDKGNSGEAKIWARAALAMPALPLLEKYETILNLAQMETRPEEARALAAQAFDLMPDRREALALMVNFAIFDKRYEDALRLAKIMMQIPYPSRTYWSLNRDWYEWKGFHLYTQTLRLNDRHADAEGLEDSVFEASGSQISLIHATRGRAVMALAARELWLSRADNPKQIEHIFAFDSDDEESEKMLSGYRHIEVTEPAGCVRAWNEAAEFSTGKILVQLSDDWIPPHGWDTELIKRIGDTKVPSVLAISDGHRKDDLMCMAICTRAYYEQDGTFFHPGFKSVYSDTWFSYMAYQRKAVIQARDFVFYHNNPYFERKDFQADATYAASNSPERYKEGKELYEKLVAENNK